MVVYTSVLSIPFAFAINKYTGKDIILFPLG